MAWLKIIDYNISIHEDKDKILVYLHVGNVVLDDRRAYGYTYEEVTGTHIHTSSSTEQWLRDGKGAYLKKVKILLSPQKANVLIHMLEKSQQGIYTALYNTDGAWISMATTKETKNLDQGFLSLKDP